MTPFLWFLLVVVFLFFYRYPSILLHELGHVVAGRLAGIEPYMVRIGRGRQLFAFTLLGVRYEVMSRIHGGRTYARYRELSRLRMRNLVYVAGGPLVTLAIAVVTLWLILADRLHGFIPLCRVLRAPAAGEESHSTR